MVILRTGLFFIALFCIRVVLANDYCTYSKNLDQFYYNDDFGSHYMRRWIILQCAKIHLPFEFIGFEETTYDYNFYEVWLKIKESNLHEIGANSFKGFSSVTDLDLSQNNITNIKQDAFAGFSSLRKLFLAKNALSELQSDVFNSLQQLHTLDASMNRIKNLNLHFLTDIIHLRYLNLSKNSLTCFDDVVLGQNHYIAQLNLSDNKISELILNRSSHRIAEIDVSKNKLTVVDICLPGLLSLNISYNKIKYVLAGKCAINMTISKLDASHNLINEVSVKNISKLSTLNFLNIGYNDMSMIPNDLFVNMSKLSYLDVSNNKLLNLEYGIFDSLKRLTYLDLSYNKLKSIKRLFYALKLLNTLKINNNEIVYIYSNLTFSDLNELSNIYLDGNKFECKQILEILNYLQIKNVKTDNGTSRDKSNIYGISCLEHNLNMEIKDDFAGFFKNIVSSKLEKPDEDNEFRRTVMYNYFNKDFLNSNFYKYLESFKNNDVHNVDKEDTLKLLKSELENSKFYKFLENFKINENWSWKKINLRDNFKNELHGSSKNSTTSYIGMFLAIILLLLFLVIKLINIYIVFNKNKSVVKEEQELLEQIHSDN